MKNPTCLIKFILLFLLRISLSHDEIMDIPDDFDTIKGVVDTAEDGAREQVMGGMGYSMPMRLRR